ncbi:MAG: hypothetical protein HFG73_00235 [Hungatella sp.]|nr:hypothetical protein [Hungatella sp.]
MGYGVGKEKPRLVGWAGHCLKYIAAAVVAVFMAVPVFGAAQKESVSTVKLTVSCEPKPEAGKEIGSVTVTQPDERIVVAEPAAYYNTDDDVWIRGEIPVIRLELSLKDTSGYRFVSSTKVSVSGFQSEVKSRKILDGGDGMRVEIKLKKVTGPVEDVAEYYWEGTSAWWSDVRDADRYEVRLYRGNSLVTTVTTGQNHFDFYPHMNRAGDYCFKVRGISSLDNQRGRWSDKSEESAVSVSDVYEGPAAGSGNGGSFSKAGWQQDGRGWIYRKEDGSPAKNTWVFADNHWFHLADNCYMDTGWIYADNHWFYLNPVSDGTKGAMKTGWQFVNNSWYYLNPVSDGTRGAMKTGWQFVNNSWYYLNPVSDGTRGAMKTGWQFVNNSWYYLNPVSDGTRGAMRTQYQNINGLWYYLDPESGSLWVNRKAPNGNWADAAGVLH